MALTRKCEILWALLDAVDRACMRPMVSPHAMFQERDGEALVVLPERAVTLGGSARQILSLCDGERSGEEVAAALRAQVAGEAPVGLTDDVHDFLREMERAGVIGFEAAAG